MMFQLLRSTKRQFLSKLLTFCLASPFSALTKKGCIELLKNCKSMAQLHQIQTQALIFGLHQNIDILGKIMVFCTDASVGNLCHSERIFCYIEKPSLFLYNLMIKASTKNRSLKKALRFFAEMRANGFSPDNYTYPFVFKAIGGLRDVLQGEKVHAFVIKSGSEFDCYVCNSIMGMYAELGLCFVSKNVFDEMPNRDLVSWNVLISGFVRCNRFHAAVEVYREMRKEQSLKPDEATVVSTLSACTALKKVELGKEIHNYISRELEFTAIISNALLDMYSKCGYLDLARKIFDEMPAKNVICWTSMVSGYVNCGDLDEARLLFETSPVKDVVLWTAMINGYVQFNRVDEAMSLFREMQIERFKPDKFTMVALLTGCAQLEALEQGKWIHEYMVENGIKIDAVVGTALIEMYAKCGCIEKSLEIFSRLKEKDTASWTSIICGLSTNGKSDKALKLFSEMKLAGFRPDDITFIGALSACSHGGMVEEGCLLFDSMKRMYQIEPKLEHYGCLIDILCRAGRLEEAEELTEKVPKERSDIVAPLYGALLNACRVYGNIDLGERVAYQLSKIESRDSSIHILLANIYASVNRWEDVSKLRKKMRAFGVKKEAGCSSIEVNGKIHGFLVQDTSHPETRNLYFMLDSIAQSMSVLETNVEEQIYEDF